MERDDTNQEATRFGSSQPSIAKSSGTGEAPHAESADPTIIDLNKARKGLGAVGSHDPSRQVADDGDVGGSHSMPYDVDAASDAMGNQTKPD